MKGQQYVDDTQLHFSLSSITVRLKKCLDSVADSIDVSHAVITSHLDDCHTFYKELPLKTVGNYT
ncbi:hypothetical protein L345_00467, partial [Ophiophagus hannah]